MPRQCNQIRRSVAVPKRGSPSNKAGGGDASSSDGHRTKSGQGQLDAKEAGSPDCAESDQDYPIDNHRWW